MKRIKLLYPLMALALALSACNTPQPTPSPSPKPTEPAPKPAASPAPSATTPSQPQPTPRPTTNPIVVDVTPARGEALPLDKPLTVRFDQPMDKASVEQALLVRGASAPVSGKIAWQSDSILTFTPQGGWKRNETYNAQVGDGARSAKGLPLNKPQSFRFSAIGSFVVAQVIPANGASDVTADATITVLFNRPVVPLVGVAQQASLPQPLSFAPEVAGKGEWVNTSVYVFKPAAPLAAGATYKVKLSPTLTDTLGAQLDEATEWSFSVSSPNIKFVSPGANARDVDLRQPISVTFSQKMDHAAAQAAFKLTPAVRGSFRWADETEPKQGQIEGPPLKDAPSASAGANTAHLGEVMTFVPEENYARATNYALEVSAGAKAAAGDGRTKEAFKSAFRTIENLALAGSTPANGATSYEADSRQFMIRFTAPVLPETVMKNISFDPPLTLTSVYTYWDAPGKQFVINNLAFLPSTKYRATIGGEISDAYGQTLGKTSVVEFATGQARPVVILGSGAEIGTLNASQPARAQVGFRNITRLDFQLSRLSLEEFYKLTGENAYQARQSYKPAEGQLLRAWSATVSAKQNELASAVIPLNENNTPLPTGVYMLTMEAPEMKTIKNAYFETVRQALVVTNYQVTMKQALSKALVWATDLTTGAPAPNLPVTLVDKNRKTLASLATGADGVALAQNVSFAQPYDPFYAIIGQPGAANFGIGFNQWTNEIEPYQFGLPTDYVNSAGPRVKTYLYTDRPIYRPGQTVNFKGIIRADNDARYSLLNGLTSVTAQVSSERGVKVYSQTVAVNGNGTFNGSFVLADGAATGYYGMNVFFPVGCALAEKQPKPGETVCQSENISFQVAAYRKPEFEVSLTAAKPDLTSGETAQVTAQASAYFGGNIGEAKVEWMLTATPYFFDRYTDRTDPFFNRYSFIDSDSVYPVWPPVPRPTGVNASGEGVTDANGKFVISAPVDLSKSETSLTLDFSASVTDLNDQMVTANAKAIAHKAPFYFGIAPEEYVLSAGSPLTAHVLAVDWDGKPLAGQGGAVTLYRREWKMSYGMSAFGDYGPQWQPEDTKLAENPITTDKDGRAATSFALTEGGEYRVVVSSGAAKASSAIWVTSGAFLRWRTGDNNRITLRPDKTQYKVGEVAKVLAPSPFSGTVNALMTIERGDILQQKVIQLKSNNDVLEIPITPEFAPNAFVSLVLVKGARTGGLAEFRLGYTELDVDPSAFEIKLEMTPDKPRYAPRETATYDIRATTASGQPVQAELSIALIDKAVLALAEPNSQPPMDVFYGQRGLLVRTSNSLSVRADVADMAKAASAPGGMGGGGGGMADQSVRQNFQDVAFWSAVTQTGADGRAQVKVTLPDNLTTWVLDARAISADTKVGSATREIITSKPLLVRPVTPRFFVVGDEATLGAVVNNNTSSAVQAQVTLAASGLALKGAAMQTVSVPANGSARVDWQVAVPDGTLADVTISAVAGELKDSAKPELGAKGIPVMRYLSPETVATAGDVSVPGKKLELVALPPRLEAGKSELEVNVNTSLAQVITTSAYFLQENAQNAEYEDNLQIAARLLVNVSQNAQPAAISEDAAKLLGRQRNDAGWGWLADSEKSSPTISAYVLWALGRAWAVAGQELGGKDQLTRGNDYLRAQLGDANTFLNRVAADESAFYAFVLSENGVAVNAYLDQLHKNKDKLGSFGRALLAMALQNVNKTDARISGLLADVNSAVIQSATGVTWSSANGGLQGWAFTAFFCTDTRATAIILLALARLDAKNPMLPNVVRWLVAARTGRTWEGAQDALWAILALDAYADATGDRNAAYDWRVSLNDTRLMEGRAASGEAAAHTAIVSATQLLSGTNSVLFERGDGEGRLYYTAQLKAFLPAAEAKALDRGIAISRIYELAECEPEPGKPCQPLTSIPLGKNVRVRLVVVAPSALYFVKVSDPFAAGMEPVEPRLRAAPMPMYRFAPWWFSNTQLYDDRAEIYADYLPAGAHEFAYVMRATLAGSFNVMPASVMQTYFPETFGRSDGMRLVVSK